MFVVWLKWKQADPSTAVQRRSLCLSRLLWFTDTDLAEPILLVILYWILAPGDSQEPSAPAALSSSLGSQTKDIHAWVRLLFSNNHEGFVSTKIESCLWRRRLKGPCLRKCLCVCNNFYSWLRQTDTFTSHSYPWWLMANPHWTLFGLHSWRKEFASHVQWHSLQRERGCRSNSLIHGSFAIQELIHFTHLIILDKCTSSHVCPVWTSLDDQMSKWPALMAAHTWLCKRDTEGGWLESKSVP